MKLGIYGAGGFGREVAETAVDQNNWEEIVFIDDFNNSDYLDGLKRVSFKEFCSTYHPDNTKVICAVGDPKHKKELYERVLMLIMD